MSWWSRWRDELRLDELPPAMLHLAVQLVEMGEARDPATRAVLLEAVVASLSAQQQGSTRIPAPPAVQELAAADAVPSLLGTHPAQFRPLIVVDGPKQQAWLYHQRTLHYERELGRRLRTRLSGEVVEPAGGAEALAEVIARPTRFAGAEVRLTDEQQHAVRLAMRRPLTVVTGGPGTGKTSIVVSLMRALVRCGIAPEKIALAAPTGKAANRLGISIEAQLNSLTELDEADVALRERGVVPVTLHRLLKYSGTLGRFRRDEDDPIDAKWVIVDEASMIDLVLMERLARCVPSDARLVLLGDVDQLPSVETGTVLRDIIGYNAPHVARLNVSHRMDPNDAAGRAILSLAHSLSEDDVELTSVDPGVSVIDTPVDEVRGRLLDFLDTWFDDKIAALPNFKQLTRRSYYLRDGEFTEDSLTALATLFAHFERYRILCLTRVFATGSDAVNEAFHLRMARNAGTDGVPDYVGGEPVMMLRNDYERQLFNGDQGLVVWVEVDHEPPRLAAIFPHEQGFAAHHLSQLSGQLAHSWAMTVHKSQGSEYDEVALLLPLQDLPLLSRELLYTAITRARRAVTILGDTHLFSLGAARTVQRWSGLPQRISEGES